MGRADQYCIRPSAMLGLGQWVEQCNLVILGFEVLSHRAHEAFPSPCIRYFSNALPATC